MSKGSTSTALWAALCGWFLLISSAAEARKLNATIDIGQGAVVWSEVLQEQRRTLIYLPPHYDQALQLRYPVMYLLDAEEQFHHVTGIVRFLVDQGRIPEMIVVGVTNTNRGRDMTPPTNTAEDKEEDREAGGADNFLRFLADELAPYIDARYRTVPYRILVGHSFGGLFSLHALVSRPQAFQAHIAVSPSLWWDSDTFAHRAREKLATLPGEHFLFLSWGDRERQIRVTTQALVEWLQKNPTGGVRWTSRHYAKENHSSTPHLSLYDGLDALYEGWELPSRIDDVDQHYTVAQVEAHFAEQSRRFGYPMIPALSSMASVGEDFLEAKDYAGALLVFDRNAAAFPHLASVHEDRGKALEGLKRPGDALVAYRRAMQLALDDEVAYWDPLAIYRDHIAELEKQFGSTSRKGSR